MKRAYYIGVFATFYGTFALAAGVAAICSGCGSGPQRLPGDRGPALIAAGPVAPLIPPVTYTPVVTAAPAAEGATVGR